MKTKSLIRRIVTVIALMVAVSCEEFVQVEMPNSQIGKETVFSSDETAIAAATGVLNSMLLSSSPIGGTAQPLAYLGGISSDELIDYVGQAPYSELYDNELNVNNSIILNIWNRTYSTIYEANALIEGVTASETLSVSVRKQLEGEGKFFRAFNYFYLVNLFGDVPMALSTDYRKNATLPRTQTMDLYKQIESDLLDAEGLLPEDYATPDRIRPNKLAATALLARVYLYTGEYAKADSKASVVIGSSMYGLVPDLNRVFLANSTEAILQLCQLYPNGIPTADGYNFTITNNFFTKSMNIELVNAFPTDDLRRAAWINSYNAPSGVFYYAYKYKHRIYTPDANYPEFLMLLRLAEQYLIRAEARTHLGSLDAAKSDLNAIRKRAGLDDIEAIDQKSMLSAIDEERRLEFFCEFGHRWFDLKRTGRANEVLGVKKPLWDETDVHYPIPEKEMLSNPRLTPQNDGY